MWSHRQPISSDKLHIFQCWQGLPEPRNVIEMSIQALYTLARATQIEAKLADVIIAPDIAHVNLVDLRSQSIEDLLQAGRLAAEAVLPQIRRDLGRS